MPAPTSGMHTSYQVPAASPTSRYLSVGWKFAIAVITASVWTGASVWISAPWVTGLAVHITIVPAILIVSLLAFMPGFVVAFLMAGLAFDRQPPLRVTSPSEPITVLIAARNEEAAIGDTVRSLAQQDYEGSLRVILIDNGSTDHTSDVARSAAAEIGFAIEILTETTPGKSHALNLGLANVTKQPRELPLMPTRFCSVLRCGCWLPDSCPRHLTYEQWRVQCWCAIVAAPSGAVCRPGTTSWASHR